MAGKEKYQQDEQIDVLEAIENTHSLIVWNDEVNTFEWVIETLVEICGHSEDRRYRISIHRYSGNT